MSAEWTADKKFLQDQLEGLQGAIRSKKEDLTLLERAAGIDETIEKTRAENELNREELTELKQVREGYKARRSKALYRSLTMFQERMSSFLVEGVPVFVLSEDGKDITFGLMKSDLFRPYQTLSSGEKVDYEAAMAQAFTENSDCRIICIEAGEMDEDRLKEMLGLISEFEDTETQLIVCFHQENAGTDALPWKDPESSIHVFDYDLGRLEAASK
jgi:hypothetical protein